MRAVKIVLLALTLLSCAVASATFEFGFKRFPPGVRALSGAIVRYSPKEVQGCLAYRARAALAFKRDVTLWERCRRQFERTSTLAAFNLRVNVFASAAVAALLFALAFLMSLRHDRRSVRVIRGRIYYKGDAARSALARIGRRERRLSGYGLEFPPGVAMSRDRESRHMFFWGSVGSGKTQAMLHLILQAIDRGDKVLVLDVKGDMTATFPRDFHLVAPQDSRSRPWRIAEDCRTRQDARELAARLIADSHDPMWSDAAREVFVACVASLQATKGQDWGWEDLRQVTLLSGDELIEVAKAYHPEAARILADPTSRTTLGVLTTFQAHMNTVSILAEAWPGTQNGGFSVKEWLNGTDATPIVLQHDGKFPLLSKSWISGVIALLGCEVASPAMSESSERRIWLFLDEFPQLERLAHFSSLLDVGRSKGVVVVLGAQDIAQIRKTYGHDQADAWIGVIGTHVITRMNLGQSAELASRLIGQQTIERRRKSHSHDRGHTTVSETIQQDVRPVVTPSELSERLGPRRNGVRVLLVGPGEHAYEVTLPFTHLPPQRPASIPAAWTTNPPREINPITPPAPPVTPAPEKTSAERKSLITPEMADHIRSIGS